MNHSSESDFGSEDTDGVEKGDIYRLPDLPRGNGDTREGWISYVKKYMKGVAKIASVINSLYDHVVVRERDMGVDDEGEVKEMYRYLTDYFVESSRRKKWTKVRYYVVKSVEETMTKGLERDDATEDAMEDVTEDDVRRTTLRTHLFWELCRLRIVYRYKEIMKNVSITTFRLKELKKRRLVLPKSTPILKYSQKELEQSFYALLRRWQMTSHHEELELYANLLLDRLSMLFCRSFSAGIFDDEDSRQRLDVTNENGTATFDGRCGDETNEGQYGPNFDFVYLSQIRYYHLIKPLWYLKNVEKKILLKDTIRTRTTNLRTNRDVGVSVSPNVFSSWCSFKAETIHGQLTEELHERYMDLLVSPGDKEWLLYKEPGGLTSMNSYGILQRRQADSFTVLIEETQKSLKDVLVKDEFDDNLSGMYEWLVLKLVDKLFGADVEFFDRYVMSRDDLDDKSLLLHVASKPLIIQLFSKYRIYYGGKLLTRPNDTVFDVVSCWTEIMLKDRPKGGSTMKLRGAIKDARKRLAEKKKETSRHHRGQRSFLFTKDTFSLSPNLVFK